MVEWILSSSVLLAVLIAIRYLFRGKISCRLQYALWLLAALRLLIPGAMFQSPASVLNVLSAVPENYETASSVQETLELKTDVPLTGYTFDLTQPEQLSPIEDLPEAQPEIRSEAPAEWTISWEAVLKAVWICGMVCMSLWLILGNIVFAVRLKRRAVPTEVSDCPLPVFQAKGLTSPCVFGLLRPRIYVTPDVLEEPEILRHILTHELTHWRHGDCWWSYVRGLCLALHWYNPLVWWAASLCKRDCELACDESTIQKLGEDNRQAYALTLIAAMAGKPSVGQLLCGATTMNGGKRGRKERIRMLARKRRTIWIAAAAAMLIAAVAVGCTFSGAEEETAAPVLEPEQGSDHAVQIVLTPTQGTSIQTAYIQETEIVPAWLVDAPRTTLAFEEYDSWQTDGMSVKYLSVGGEITYLDVDGYFTVASDHLEENTVCFINSQGELAYISADSYGPREQVSPFPDYPFSEYSLDVNSNGDMTSGRFSLFYVNPETGEKTALLENVLWYQNEDTLEDQYFPLMDFYTLRRQANGTTWLLNLLSGVEQELKGFLWTGGNFITDEKGHHAVWFGESSLGLLDYDAGTFTILNRTGSGMEEMTYSGFLGGNTVGVVAGGRYLFLYHFGTSSASLSSQENLQTPGGSEPDVESELVQSLQNMKPEDIKNVTGILAADQTASAETGLMEEITAKLHVAIGNVVSHDLPKYNGIWWIEIDLRTSGEGVVLRAGLDENIVEISGKGDLLGESVMVEDETLYRLLRTSCDVPDIGIDREIYERHATEIDAYLADVPEAPGIIAHRELTGLTLAGTAEDLNAEFYLVTDVCIVDPPEKAPVLLAGGAYLDSQLRIYGLNWQQYLVVVDGETIGFCSYDLFTNACDQGRYTQKGALVLAVQNEV